MIKAIDEFSIALIEALPDDAGLIQNARKRSESFLFGELVDVFDFADNCRQIPGLRESATKVMAAVDVAVVARTINTVLHPNGHGLSLYFPSFEPTTPPVYFSYSFEKQADRYRNYGLSFIDETHWFDFLKAYFTVRE